MDKERNIYYEEVPAEHALSAYVHHFWKTNFDAKDDIYTILPDGYFDLIIEVEGTTVKKISLFGLYTRQIDIVIQKGITYIGIAFKPLAAEYIFNISISPLLNASDILPGSFWNIRDIAGDNFQSLVKRLSKEMTAALKRTKRPDMRKHRLFESIFTARGCVGIQDLADGIFWNARQINRYFNAWLGLPVKTYNSIIRCAAAYEDLHKGALYPDQQFYDQSHFIKEIKKRTGHTPSALHQDKNDRILLFQTLAEK